MARQTRGNRLLPANIRAIQKAVKSVSGVGGKATEFRIKGERRLVLHVLPSGTATWYVHYDVDVRQADSMIASARMDLICCPGFVYASGLITRIMRLRIRTSLRISRAVPVSTRVGLPWQAASHQKPEAVLLACTAELSPRAAHTGPDGLPVNASTAGRVSYASKLRPKFLGKGPRRTNGPPTFPLAVPDRGLVGYV